MKTRPAIGIPQALFYYLIYPFWKTFWQELGCKVLVSPPTTKGVLDEGVKEAVTDACVPIKVYHGHIRYLADKVDYLFVPRLINIRGNYTFCPKFLGLPDLIKHSMEGLPPLISPRIDRKRHFWQRLSGSGSENFSQCCQVASFVTSSRRDIWRAYRAGKRAQQQFTRYLTGGLTPAEAIARLDGKQIPLPPRDSDIALAVLGYPYALYDPYISVDLVGRLRQMKVKVVTPEMFPDRQLRRSRPDLAKELFWHFSDRNVRSAIAAFERGDINGIIHVTAFGCGPDFMVNKLIELECKQRTVPFLSLSIDEQSAEAGMITRLEAFTDMIRRRNARAS